jgi:hypothetical protein
MNIGGNLNIKGSETGRIYINSENQSNTPKEGVTPCAVYNLETGKWELPKAVDTEELDKQ